MLAATLLTTAHTAMAIEEPAFTTLTEDREYSVRQYAARVVAETTVAGSLRTASNAGFRRIAGYIFGRNHARGGGSARKIAMTAPVTVEPTSRRIAMTAPVTVGGDGEGWRVQFVMPAGYTLATLPVPDDPAVTLREVAPARYAVVRFSGLVGEERLREETARLREWMQRRGLAAGGDPSLARYNPPWTLPFLRRNEVLIPLL